MRKETTLEQGQRSPFVSMGTFQMKRFFLVLGLLLLHAGISQARDSLGMRLLGQTLLGPARQVVVQGNYAYVGASCGLLILDVSDPANPVEMGRAYDVNFTIIEDVFVLNGYAYLVDAYNGLAIVDVRDVRNPRVVGRAWDNGHMFGVWVKDSLAYMVGSNSIQDSSDFLVINVKEPTNPVAIKGYDMFFTGHRLWIVDTLAFMPAGIYIEVFSVADPCSMYQVARYAGVGGSQDIWIRDTLCYVVSQDSGLVIVNIKDPLNPIKLGRCKPNGLPMRVSVLGNYAYLCEDYFEYDRYPPSNLSHMWVIDISDPASPVELGRYETAGSGGDVFVKDSLVYFADGRRGLRLMDVRNPSQPREITHYSTGDACWELVRQGDYLYVAHGGDGLRVLDVSNPAQPVELGHLEMPWRTFDIMLKDTLLYAAEGDSGLVVVDIRNPAQPVIIGRWVPTSPWDFIVNLFVQDSLAYLCGRFNGRLWIVNVADPRNPYLISRTGGWARDFWVQGRYAFMSGSNTWPYIVMDVSNPRNPRDVYWTVWITSANEVEYADTLGYLLGVVGLQVVTIGDPLQPDTAGWYGYGPAWEYDGYGLHYVTPGYVWMGGRLRPLSGAWVGKIELIDVRDPHRPQSIRHYDTGWTIQDVWGDEGKPYAYGGAYMGNIFVFFVDSAVGVAESEDRTLRIEPLNLEVRPNPIRGSCTIRLSPSLEGKVHLSIYDVTGRVVRSFAPYASRLTPYEIYWDLRDDRGKEVKSGVYLLRAETGGQATTHKLVVVR